MSPTTPLDPTPTPSGPSGGLALVRREAARAAHWRATRRLTAVLMTLWLCTGFGTVFFARELARFTLFGWPLSFYMAAQGASLVSLVIIAFYAWRLRRFDRLYEAAAREDA